MKRFMIRYVKNIANYLNIYTDHGLYDYKTPHYFFFLSVCSNNRQFQVGNLNTPKNREL